MLTVVRKSLQKKTVDDSTSRLKGYNILIPYILNNKRVTIRVVSKDIHWVKHVLPTREKYVPTKDVRLSKISKNVDIRVLLTGH